MLALPSTGLIRLETEERTKSFLLSEVGDIAFRVPQGRNSLQSNTEKLSPCSWENSGSC